MTKTHFLFACLFFTTIKSFGQDLVVLNDTLSTSLNTVIINENRLQIPFTEQNRNINLITQEQITHLPVNSVNELLSYVAGVDMRQRGPWGSQGDLSLDGGTFEQTTILINGIKITDPQTAHHNLNLPIPLDAIERIEILKGPAARIYGINSLTGAINIVTKKTLATPLLINARLGSGFRSADEEDKGLYNNRSIQIGTGISHEEANHMFLASYDAGNGYRYNTPFKNSKLFYQGNINNSKNGLWNFLAAYTSNDFGANAYYAPPIDREAKEIVQTGIASIAYQAELPHGWSIAPRFSYRFNHDDYRFNQYDLTTGRNLHNSHVLNSEINATYKSALGIIGLGGEVRNEYLNSTNLGNHNRDNFGLYAEYKTPLAKPFSFNIGTYLNYNSLFGWKIYPGLDLGYQVHQHVRLYVNTGTGQRIPSFTDLYTKGGGNIGNPELQPENAWYAEGGIKINTDKWFIAANYFYRDIEDFIDWTRYTVDESWSPSNFSRNKVQGINFNANYHFIANTHSAARWLANLSYTYLRPSINISDQAVLSKYAIESLKHQLVGSIIFSSKHLSGSLTERFLERISYKNYLITDAKIAWGWKKYQISADANNLFNVTYIESSAIPLPGRWFSLGFHYRY